MESKSWSALQNFASITISARGIYDSRPLGVNTAVLIEKSSFSSIYLVGEGGITIMVAKKPSVSLQYIFTS